MDLGRLLTLFMSLAILSHISLSSYYMLYKLLHFAILTGYSIPRLLPRTLPIVCSNPPLQGSRQEQQ